MIGEVRGAKGRRVRASGVPPLTKVAATQTKNRIVGVMLYSLRNSTCQ